MALTVKSCVNRLALSAIGSSTMNRISYAFRQHNFSSVAEVPKDLVDATLSNVLKCEIKSAKSNLKISQVETPTDSFPFIIKEDRYGWSQFYLEREFPNAEYVSVKIDVDKIELSNEDDKEWDGSKKDIKPAIPMGVSIIKNNSECQLSFDIIVSNENIIVENLTIFHGGGFTDIDGTDIREMDNELQRYLTKYLEVRGITSNITSFLLKMKVISQKKKEVDFMSLKNLKKVIEH